MNRALLYGSLVAGALAVLFTLMPPVDQIVTCMALLFALLHFATTFVFLRRVRSAYKWLLLVWSTPVVLMTLENIRLLFVWFRFGSVCFEYATSTV
jgi:hypothetical protein